MSKIIPLKDLQQMKNPINIFYWIAMAGLFTYFAYTKGWILANFESISTRQAYTLLQEENNVTLLDVRSVGEYKRGHIQKATLIPVEVLSKNVSKLQRDKKIIVYCQTGSRSVRASRILVKHGFTPLNVKGGFKVWEEEGLGKKYGE
jgi:rhodanese-related sulfurtransferase